MLGDADLKKLVSPGHLSQSKPTTLIACIFPNSCLDHRQEHIGVCLVLNLYLEQ